MKNEINLEIIADSNIGKVRELNEDNFIATNNISGPEWILPDNKYLNSSPGTIIAIADGMGGANAGEVASRIAIETLPQYFTTSRPNTSKKKLEVLKNCLLNAHYSILKHAVMNKETKGMGTTFIVGWIKETKLYLCWSGDSRCYLYRNSKGLTQISKDHSYVQTLIENGKITREQSFYHPERNIILQSLGNADKTPEPDALEVLLENEDIILMCSDGLSGMLTDSEIEIILDSNKGNVRIAVNTLIEKANQAGGSDNITIILAKVYKEDLINIEKLNLKKTFEQNKQTKKLKWFLLILLIATIMGTAIFFLINSNVFQKMIKKSTNKSIPAAIWR